MSCGVGCRRGSDLALLWLWCRPAATAANWTPSLGTSLCSRCNHRKGKKKRKEKEKRTIEKTEGSIGKQRRVLYCGFRSWVP